MAVVYDGRTPTKVDSSAPMLAIGIPSRGEVPIEFMIHLLQILPPLNVRLSYVIQTGKLPAEARNLILERSIEAGAQYVWFLDDDVLFPDVTLYRLWVLMQKHPEAACITGIYGTKLTPTEPLIYADSGSGAYWDWPLGVLLPIHSAGAGCMLVNLSYVKKLTPPYFDDIVRDTKIEGGRHRNLYGQDRYFHRRLAEDAGGVIYADTGLLLGHWESQMHRPFLLPPDSPCFQQRVRGEAFIPYIDERGVLMWRRVINFEEHDPNFVGYLDWLKSRQSQDAPTLIPSSMVEATTPELDGSPVERFRKLAGMA